MRKYYIAGIILFVCLLILLLILIPIPWGGLKYTSYRAVEYFHNRVIKLRHEKGKLLNKEICHENLGLIHEVFKKHNIFFWLGEGTALGFFRDNDFISYDNDTDLGLFEKDKKKFHNCIKELKKKGFVVGDIQMHGTFVCVFRKNEKIDIDITGKGSRCMSVYNKKCDLILPYLKSFNNILIRGKQYNIPKLDYIEKVYGKEWYVPKR